MEYVRYEVGTNQIVATQRAGRACFQMTTASDEPCGKWGDGNGGVRRKRAQFREKGNQAMGSISDIRFATLIPEDWEHDPYRGTSIFDLHGPASAPKTPWGMNIKGDLLGWCGQVEGWNIHWEGLIVPEQWDDWRILYQCTDQQDGWLNLWRNGVQIVSLSNVKTAFPDPLGNYFKVGPYMWGGDVVTALRDATNYGGTGMPKYRRMFVQIP